MGKLGIVGASVMIFKNIVGAGVLNLPILLHQGLGFWFFLLLIGSCYIMYSSALLIVRSAKLSEAYEPKGNKLDSAASPHSSLLSNGSVSHVKTYESVVETAFGPTGKYVALTIFLLVNTAALASYAIIMRNSIATVVDTLLPSWKFWSLLVFLLFMVVVVSPLCFLRSVSILSIPASISSGALVILFIYLVSESWSDFYTDLRSAKALAINDIGWARFFAPTPSDWFSLQGYVDMFPGRPFFDGASSILFSLVCHTGVNLIYEDLENKSISRMRTVLSCGYLMSGLFYCLVVVAGYNAYHDYLLPDILLNTRHVVYQCEDGTTTCLHPKEAPYNAGWGPMGLHLVFLVMVGLTFPLMQFNSATSMVELIESLWDRKDYRIVHGCRVFNIGLACLVATRVEGLDTVMKFSGCFLVPFLVFIIPGVTYCKLKAFNTPFFSSSLLTNRRAGTLAIAIGIFMVIYGTLMAIWGWQVPLRRAIPDPAIVQQVISKPSHS